MKPFFAILFVFLIPGLLPAQEKINFEYGCNYESDDVSGLLTLNLPSRKAEKIVKEILDTVGMEKNFQLKVANVANARATEKNGTRYILYSERFLESFEISALTKWAGYSLLAHEIGHHVKRHDFSSNDMDIRHRQELEADEFSARVLAKLGATTEEVLAGIRVYSGGGESATHPGSAAREDAIRKAFRNELETMEGTRDLEKFFLALDQNAFRKNRWNLLKKAQAEIDDEKITIRYRIPHALPGQYFKVCLLSNDGLIVPGMRDTGAIKGVGGMVPYQTEGLIVWNYRRLDGYSKLEVSKGGMLKVMAYDIYQQPQPPGKLKKASRWGFTVLGGAAIGYGIFQFIQGQNIYQVYKKITDPDDPVYRVESRSDRYKRANGHHLLGQYFGIGGGALASLGIVLFVDTARHKRTYNDAVCWQPSRRRLEPGLVAAPLIGGPSQLSIRLTF